ncbi:hypothetical protein FPQ18DRAFT_308931 [Pyronema domesticum]|uniref:Uncharacterized protein n=1 Tax=Pyronema omphalodes (strain CBS 100304) TaxID=1076935 RepID=U4LD05_PYROM|nr:hypothetical protein FPQ18DRAFT_308931 [Pyronema domesticum]CCX29989.1 Protein of unknown function [Pyronema omphalodes CBS 100304]
MEEHEERVQEGDTKALAPPPKQGPYSEESRRHQKRATWAEVVATGGVNIPAVFGLLGLNLGGKGAHRSRNRRTGRPQKARMEKGGMEEGGTEGGATGGKGS